MKKTSNKNRPLLLGCIADDITGATDLGLAMVSNGLPTTLFLGIPQHGQHFSTEAVVIALKIRTINARDAVSQASAVADWLLARKARQLFYKYCSTFDSTAKGNIGPVTDALMRKTHSAMTVMLPAFPENGRTVRNGNLYVDGSPLSESSMRDHPLTPMTESYIPTLMDAQTEQGKTAAIPQSTVDAGSEAILDALTQLRDESIRYACIDTNSAADLDAIAGAVADFPLLTGASGIARAIPDVLRARGLLPVEPKMTALPKLAGRAAVLAGSCSQATRKQIEVFKDAAHPIIIDPLALDQGRTDKHVIAEQALTAIEDNDILVYSSANPDALRAIQDKLGVTKSANLIEDAIAYIAMRLADAGISKFVVAGGETSGAVANALSIGQLEIAAEIDPGVAWMVTTANMPVCLAFKSGNFGRTDFFRHALAMLP